MVRSEDQEEELISSIYMGGLPSSGTSRGQKVIVGGASGIMTLWEKGAWDDQDERIRVHRDNEGGDAIETMAIAPDFLGKGKLVAAGLSNGQVKFVRIGPNKVVSEVVHDEIEGVVGLGFDVEGRLVSGGGQVVKVWHDTGDAGAGAGDKHMMDSDDSDEDSESEAEERPQEPKDRKKRKKGKGKDMSGGQHVMAFHDLD
jgi:hypothetical protein